MSGVDVGAAQAAMRQAAFIETAAAAYGRVVADLAKAAEAEGLSFEEAVSAITTGGQASIVRLVCRFSVYETADDATAAIHVAVDALAPGIFAEEMAKRPTTGTA